MRERNRATSYNEPMTMTSVIFGLAILGLIYGAFFLIFWNDRNNCKKAGGVYMYSSRTCAMPLRKE
jgi:hypothetical protein